MSESGGTRFGSRQHNNYYKHDREYSRPYYNRARGFNPFFNRGRGLGAHRMLNGGDGPNNDSYHSRGALFGVRRYGEYRRPPYTPNFYSGRKRYRSRSRSPPSDHQNEYSNRVKRERSVDNSIIPKYPSDDASPDQPLTLDSRDLFAELKRRSALRRKALTREYQVDNFDAVINKCNSAFPEHEKGVKALIDRELNKVPLWGFSFPSGKNSSNNKTSKVVFKEESSEASHKNSSSASSLSFPKSDEVQDGDSTEPPNTSETGEAVEEDDARSRKFNPSLKPSNDYCQHYVDSDLRPQNFVHDSGYENRFKEYPKLRELIFLKDELVKATNTPPMYMNCDLEQYDLKRLRSVFDVIMISAPLVNGYTADSDDARLKRWSFEELSAKLNIEAISAQRGFIFMWCGTSENVDECRECIHNWNFRRCEDICWIKTNSVNRDTPRRFEPGTLFHRTKQHCLVGIKGTVKRNQDGNFIHANTDLDLILSEEPEFFSDDKPEEIFKIIQHFCLGRRRLHLFGSDKDVRPGWLTIGPNVTGSNFDHYRYKSWFVPKPNVQIPHGHLTGCPDRIEALRPKTPPRMSYDNTDYKDPIPNTLLSST